MTTSVSRKLLRSLPMTRRAADGLKDAIACDDVARFREHYADAIAKPLKRIRRLTKKRSLLANWSQQMLDLSGRERELAAALEESGGPQSGSAASRKVRRKDDSSARRKRKTTGSRYQDALDDWLSDLSGPLGAWESIAIPELLLRDAWGLSAESFVTALAAIADAVRHEPSDEHFDTETAPLTASLETMIRDFEFPIVAGLLLSPCGGLTPVPKSSLATLSNFLTQSFDADGVAHGSLLRELATWLSPVARSAAWSSAFRQPLGDADTISRLTSVTERSATLLVHRDPDHDTVVQDRPQLEDVLSVLLSVVDVPSERPVRKLIRAARKPAGKVTVPPRPAKPESRKQAKAGDPADAAQASAGHRPPLTASVQSDTSHVAILRSSLLPDADVITLDWSSTSLRLLLAAAGVPVVDGDWSWSVRVDDQPLALTMHWKCSCWYTDRDAVFIELEGPDDEAVKRVRQILLAPCDRFAMLTDSVTSRDPHRRVQLTTSLPLVAGASGAGDPVTRELQVSTGSRTVRAFPLWLDDDRIQHVHGSFQEHDGQLELSAVGQGGVTVPLALDWHPKRRQKPADWTRLTVVENRRVTGSHEAGGHRIRIGDHQVLVYRSLLKPETSRSVLGLHTWDETVYSRIQPGKTPMAHYVEVEPPTSSK